MTGFFIIKEFSLITTVVKVIEDNGRKATSLQLDTDVVSSFDDFASRLANVLKEKWDREQFNILVNNAGFGIHVPVAETTEEQFDNMMNVQFKGVFFLTQSYFPALPTMVESSIFQQA